MLQESLLYYVVIVAIILQSYSNHPLCRITPCEDTQGAIHTCRENLIRVCLFVCCFFFFFFFGVQRKRSLEYSFKRFYPGKRYGICLYECILWQSTYVLSLSLCLSVSVCLYHSDRSERTYLSPENQSNVEANGYSRSVAHEKLCESRFSS